MTPSEQTISRGVRDSCETIETKVEMLVEARAGLKFQRLGFGPTPSRC